MGQAAFKSGESARIRHSIHSPYAGRVGIVLDVDSKDARGAYLVLFSDGLQFRYREMELEPINQTRHSNVFGTLYRVISKTSHNLWRATPSR